MTARRAAQQVRHAPKSPPSEAATGEVVEGQDGASTALRYVVPGRPVTWQRTNEVKGRRVTDAAQREAKRLHALCALAALGPRRASWSLDGAFAIEVTGYWPDAVVGDSDRLAGLPMDALQGVAYRSDRQVRRETGSVETDYEGPPRTVVRLVRLAVDPVQRKPRKRQRRT